MKKALLDQIEVTSQGHLQIRIRKVVDVGGEILDLGFHRTVINVGDDPGFSMEIVNNHLMAMGFAPLDENSVDRISKFAELAATPELVDAYRSQISQGDGDGSLPIP